MFNEFEKRLISSLILVPTVIFFIIQGSIFFSIFLSLIFLITSHEWLKMKKKKLYNQFYWNNILTYFILLRLLSP